MWTNRPGTGADEQGRRVDDAQLAAGHDQVLRLDRERVDALDDDGVLELLPLLAGLEVRVLRLGLGRGGTSEGEGEDLREAHFGWRLWVEPWNRFVNECGGGSAERAGGGCGGGCCVMDEERTDSGA